MGLCYTEVKGGRIRKYVQKISMEVETRFLRSSFPSWNVRWNDRYGEAYSIK